MMNATPPIFLFAFLFIAPLFIFPQEGPGFQHVRLAWPLDEYALNYQVVVEKDDNGIFRPVLGETTFDPFIELSLAPGRYRCRVIPYDYFERPGIESQWIFFEVSEPKVPESEVRENEAGESETGESASQSESPEQLHPAASIFPLNVYLGAAWMPLLPVYEKDNMFFRPGISLLGAGARLGALYSGFGYLNLGLEAAASWYAFNTNGALAHTITAGLNLVAQKRRLDGMVALNFRLGGGLVFLEDEKCPFTSLGLSFLLFPHQRFFLEAGLDYTHLFNGGPSGCFRPFIGIGLQF